MESGADFQNFLIWFVIWNVVLRLPPGPTEIASQYRLNGLHGLISTIFAIGYIHGLLSDNLTMAVTQAYFVVDLLNMLINDIHGVKSFHAPDSRKIEYIHHVLSCSALVVLQLSHKEICPFESNPGPYLMLSEASTPFLVIWRYYKSDFFAVLFVITFTLVRMIYLGVIYIPYCLRECNFGITFIFAAPFYAVNIFFAYKIIKVVIGKLTGKSKGPKKTDLVEGSEGKASVVAAAGKEE